MTPTMSDIKSGGSYAEAKAEARAAPDTRSALFINPLNLGYSANLESDRKVIYRGQHDLPISD